MPNDLPDGIDIRCCDCLSPEGLPSLADGSVDMVLADLPYGTTACEWDSVISLEPLWNQYKRIIKPRGPIVLTAAQPFATSLIATNLEWFCYEWIWVKDRKTGAWNAKEMPMRGHESVLVFGRPLPRYYPIMEMRAKPITAKTPMSKSTVYGGIGNQKESYRRRTDSKCPDTVLYFATERGLHPTQKPISLFEYLILTYTNPGDLVVDNCLGSGTTAEACYRLGRRCIGMDKEPKYIEIAKRRLSQLRLPV